MKEFDKIIGYDAIKNELLRLCDILINPEKYSKFDVKIPQGLLLYGEPGVGKTLMAECFIKASKRKCFVCRKDRPNGEFVNAIRETFSSVLGSSLTTFAGFLALCTLTYHFYIDYIN